MSDVRQVAWSQGPSLRPVQERGPRRERRSGSFEERLGPEERAQGQEERRARPAGRPAPGDEESGKHLNVVG